MGTIRTGTCSWTDPTLLHSGSYPQGANTAEARLQFYASRFDLVEVDSTYYSLLPESMARLWVERTPPDFVFNIKAFSLFTQHPTQVRALPRDVRAMGPAAQEKKNLYQKDLPTEAVDLLWRRFAEALLPLGSAGKLGVVLFQFPEWFFPRSDSREHILSCQERLPQYRMAVEFRNGSWLNEKNRDRTLGFLRDNGLIYVSVDEPQGFRSSVPPVVEATSDVAVVRFHGRNRETWEKKGISVAERFRYLYSRREVRLRLREIRESRFITQRELAAKAGVGLSTIVRLEKGYQKPTFQTIKRLAAALGVDPSELILRAPNRSYRRDVGNDA